ncbi:MAG: Dabb family protein [Bauldia sp.]|uniref:Dabb family protein n=1 Tax=Bauldia sp. TaxID=2575872 RepID=UPI001D883EE9|nr:Dabb family protein [Bauldia sp.]MCB1496943.1 Dabb family protein [Bauldia sp.]
MQKTRLRHVVLFGFKDATSDEEIDEIVRRFAALPEEIPGIEAFECGVNNSPEGIDRGHSHCFILTFASEAARDAYLPHPAHEAFVAFASEWIGNALVIDYWAQEP